jgi:hypothetical protein
VAVKFWVKLSFKFGGFVGEIPTDVNVAVDLGVLVVFDNEDDFVVVVVVVIIMVLEEEGCVSVVVVVDFGEHADMTMVKTKISPITRQYINNCFCLIFIVTCPLF